MHTIITVAAGLPLLSAAVQAAPDKPARPAEKAPLAPILVQPVPRCPAKFVTALAADADGTVWVGTEGQGVFRLPPDGGKAQPFTAKNGLGDDNAHAVAIDHQGRVWAGTGTAGVAVYNGEGWRRYSVEEGLPGERVFAIAVSPADGDVWIATSGGLARWRARTDEWSEYTRLDGLPADQFQSLAFADDGTIYAGTQCDGIAIGNPCPATAGVGGPPSSHLPPDCGVRGRTTGRPTPPNPARLSARGFRSSAAGEAPPGNGMRWKTVQAPCGFRAAGKLWPVPLEAEGAGLPSNLINRVFMAAGGTVYAATTCGLAWSKDGGRQWNYLRGNDWVAKAEGLWLGPPPGWKRPPVEEAARQLPEDYVTAVAEDDAGRLWLGFRERECAVFDPRTRLAATPAKCGANTRLGDCVSALLFLPDGSLLVGNYGGGLQLMPWGRRGGKTPYFPPAPRLPAPPHPTPAAPPDEGRMAALLAAACRAAAAPAAEKGAFLGEDWTTRGDWCGRYGWRSALLCAVQAQLGNSECGLRQPGLFYSIRLQGGIGPHNNGSDFLRHWIHWPVTKERRTLYWPKYGIRRQAEWDDHGEAYPRTHEGPDLWIRVMVPDGAYRVSLYFYNKDGHDGANRMRDYLVELRREEDDRTAGGLRGAAPLARTRVRDFWGGVYKSFMLRGPDTYHIRIARNGSLNAVCSAVLVDPLAETGVIPPRAAGYSQDTFHWNFEPPSVVAVTPATHPALASSLALWAQADRCAMQPAGAPWCGPLKRLAYRAALARDPPPELAANWRWRLCRWNAEERRAFDAAAANAWAAEQEANQRLKTREWAPHSPGTVTDTWKEYEFKCLGRKAWMTDAQFNAILRERREEELHDKWVLTPEQRQEKAERRRKQEEMKEYME